MFLSQLFPNSFSWSVKCLATTTHDPGKMITNDSTIAINIYCGTVVPFSGPFVSIVHPSLLS